LKNNKRKSKICGSTKNKKSNKENMYVESFVNKVIECMAFSKDRKINEV